MLCRSPFVKDSTGRSWKLSIVKEMTPEQRKALRLKSVPFPCGQCLPCRINKRRIWTARMVLESYCHPYSVFVTLTYDDDHLPDDRQLSKRDAQLFLKRLRKAVEPLRIRYYLCGEYGPQTHRPHYHAIIFGLSPAHGQIINNCWCKGFCVVGDDCNDLTIQYVAGYVTKKITKKDDGNCPEFALMSRKPAIGVPFLPYFHKVLGDPFYAGLFDADCGGVPVQIRIGGRAYPLGRTLRNRLGLLLDRDGECERWLNLQGPAILDAVRRIEHVGEYLSRIDDGRAARQASRYRIFSRRDKI